jgi:hypothetical protein
LKYLISALLVASAVATYVVLDNNGKKRPVAKGDVKYSEKIKAKKSIDQLLAENSELLGLDEVEEQELKPVKVQKAPVKKVIKALMSKPAIKKRTVKLNKKKVVTIDSIETRQAAPQREESTTEEIASEETTNKESEESNAAPVTAGAMNAQMGNLNKKWSANIINMVETNMYEDGAYEKAYRAVNWSFLNYRFNKDLTGFVWLKAQKDLRNEYEETELLNTDLNITKRNVYNSGRLRMNLGFGAVLPTNETSRLRDYMMGRVHISPNFTYMLSDRTSLTYIPRINHTFNEYKFNRLENRITRNQLVQFFVLNHMMSDRLNLSGLLIYVNSWDYFGDEQNPQYLTSFEATYGINKNNAVALELGNADVLYRQERGDDKRIEIFDPETSTLTAKWIISL